MSDYKKGENMFYLVYTDHLGGRMAESLKGRDKAIKRFMIVSRDGVRDSALYFDQSGFHSTTQLAFLVLWHSPDGRCYWGNSMRSNMRSKEERQSIKERRFFVDE